VDRHPLAAHLLGEFGEPFDDRGDPPARIVEDHRVLVRLVEQVVRRSGQPDEVRPRDEVELVVDDPPPAVLDPVLVEEDLAFLVRRRLVDGVLDDHLDVVVGQAVPIRAGHRPEEVDPDDSFLLHVRLDQFARAFHDRPPGCRKNETREVPRGLVGGTGLEPVTSCTSSMRSPS
jgi:hypothetical protein